MARLLLLLFLALGFSCSTGSGGRDAGDDGNPGDDGGAGDDAGPGDLGGRPDYDPAQSFLILVPNQTSLCHGFAQDRTWQQALAMIGRIDLLPGYYVLPRQDGFTRLELIGRIIFGPEHQELMPTAAAGEIQAEYQDWDSGEWQYTFRKDFTAQGKIYHLEVRFNLRNPGTGWPAELVVESGDHNFETSARLTIDPGAIDEIQAFGLCDLPAYRRYTASIASGDQVVLDVRMGPYLTTCLAAGETACLFLTRAEVTMGAYQANVSDRLDLVYVGSHHNWYDEYLILLDPPAGSTHALWIDAPDFMGGTGYLIELDENLDEVSRDEITNWQQE